MNHGKTVEEILQAQGLKPLSKTWAKVEVLAGLIAAFLGLAWVVSLSCTPNGVPQPGSMNFGEFLGAMGLFVLGAYLAMAGHRSHLYQSNNLLTAFLVEEIRKKKDPSA
jgi:hypothetical protein